ncbi:MAG: SUKH-4 family immunity protein [Bacteroidales bacterium]
MANIVKDTATMNWTARFSKINKYDSKRVDKFGFNESTSMFLKTIGLPEEAAPFLSFAKDNDEQYEGLLKLTDYFDFLESEFDRYIVIGSTGNGDEIVIDLNDNCKIKVLDHEDNFSEEFANSSIEKFAKGLILYQDFIDLILNENGEDALIDSKFSDNQINYLKQKMIDNDQDSINSDCFWSQEIEMLIINRDENK